MNVWYLENVGYATLERFYVEMKRKPSMSSDAKSSQSWNIGEIAKQANLIVFWNILTVICHHFCVTTGNWVTLIPRNVQIIDGVRQRTGSWRFTHNSWQCAPVIPWILQCRGIQSFTIRHTLTLDLAPQPHIQYV